MYQNTNNTYKYLQICKYLLNILILYMNAILHNGTLWVSGGTNIKYSYDGISWTTVA